jgi:hypothetical protein
MVQPGPGGFSQIDSEELDDEQIIICPSHSTCKAVILHPDAGDGFAVVFGDVARRPKASQKMGVVHSASEYLGTDPFRVEVASLMIVVATVMWVSCMWIGMHAVTPWATPSVHQTFRSGARPAHSFVVARQAYNADSR